jgi:hypothetical protein
MTDQITLGQIINEIDKKVKSREVVNFWTFDDYKDLARHLFEKKRIVSIPVELSKSEKGKIQKKPLVKWKEINPQTWKDLELYWELAVAKSKKKNLVLKGEYGEHTREYKKEINTTGIAILTGKISGITTVDIDDLNRFKEQLGLSDKEIEELLKSTLVVKTPSGGYHLHYKYTPELKTSTRQGLGFDIRNDKGLVVIPPSRLPEDPTPIYLIYHDSCLNEIPGWLLKKLKKAINAVEPKKFISNLTNSEKNLSENQIKEIVDLFTPIWVSGHRHNLTLYLAGALYKAGVKQEQAEEIISRICTIAGDEELEHRLYIVNYTYTERAEDLKKEGKELKGLSGLEEELNNLIEEGVINENGAYHILHELQSILKTKKEKDITLFVLTSYSPPKGYASIAKKKCVVAWKRTKDGTFQFQDKIINAYISDVKITHDPEDQEKYFTVTLVTPAGITMKLQGTQPMIVEAIINKGLHATYKREVDKALANLLSAMEEKGLAEVKTVPRYEGFFLYNDELIANWSFLEKISDLSEQQIEENIRTALRFLDSHITIFGERKKKELATVIKFALTSPFYYIRKYNTNISPFKWLFLVGVKDTGKTKDAELCATLWGVEEKFITKSEIIRVPTFSRIISQRTFAVIADETASLFPKDRENAYQLSDALEHLKKFWKDREARSIATGKNTSQKFLALSPIIFTANRTPFLLPPEQKRIKVIEYPVSAMVTDEEKKAFAEFMNEAEQYYPYIGYAAYLLLKENWKKIFEVDTFEELGEYILKEIYKRYTGTVPDWVELRAEDVAELQESETAEAQAYNILENIVAGIIDFIRKKVGKDTGIRSCLNNKATIKADCLVHHAVMADLSAPVAAYGDGNEKYLALRSGILSILNERGIEIATLNALASMLSPLEATIKKIKIRSRAWNGVYAVLIPYKIVNAYLEEVYGSSNIDEREIEKFYNENNDNNIDTDDIDLSL